MPTDIVINGTVYDGENNIAVNKRIKFTPVSVSGAVIWSAHFNALTNASGLIKAADGTSDLIAIAGATYLVEAPVLGFDGEGATITLPPSGPVDFASLVAATAYTAAGITLKNEGVALGGYFTSIDVVGVNAAITGAAGAATLTIGSAPPDATFITQTPSGSLSAEQSLSLLATGLLKNTTNTGVLSIATGSDLPSGIPLARLSITGTPDGSKFLRDDATWQTVAAGVTSFSSRVGAVIPAQDDYTFAQLASKPTTLSGYGISDAVPSTRTVNGHALSSNVTVTPTDLGLVIGTNVQAFSSNLSTFATIAPSANVQTLLGAADFSAFRSSLGLGSLATQSGTFSGTSSGANTGDQTPASLGLVIGTNVQAWDADLDVWATKTPYAGNLTITTGKTLNATSSLTLSGTDGSSLAIGAGGTLGSAAYTNSTAYEVPLTFGSGVSRSVNAISLDQAFAPTWTGAHVHSLSNAAAFAIGPNGNTNPVLRIVTNVASAASGISITGKADGTGPEILSLSRTQQASSIAGNGLAITADPAIAGSSNAGAAAGGSVTITAGAAARLTSGNANGGNINLVPGAGIGTGTAGQVVGPSFASTTVPAYTFSGETTTGIGRGSSNILSAIVAGTESMRFFTSGVVANLYYFGIGLNTAGLSLISSGLIGVGTGTAASFAGSLKCTDIFTNNAAALIRTNTALTGGGTGNAPTLTSGPVNGNPTKWIPIDDNGTTRYIPAW